VTLTADGADVQPAHALTDAAGNALFHLRPKEYGVTLTARVTHPDGMQAELTTSVPVVPGALLAEVRGNELWVFSPIERPSAHVTLVSERGRIAGRTVALEPEGAGRARGKFALPALPAEPVWAVTASDVAAPSVARVGWPLFASGDPERTLDVDDALLLDGFPLAESRERGRRLRVYRKALLAGLLGAFGSAAFVIYSSLVQQAALAAHLGAELGEERAQKVLPRRRGLLIAGIVLIMAGFFGVALLVGWRLLRVP
jgi:hypothetical protein